MPLRELPEIISQNGVLVTTLEASERKVKVGDVWIDAKVYNGEYAGPVLRVHPGDVMRIKFVNNLSESSNLHFHGLHTSPRNGSDNVHVVVRPGQSFDYEVRIPLSQTAGLYWYHAHIHGLAEEQIMSGLSGTIIVENSAPQFPGITERLFVLKDFTFDKSTDHQVTTYYRKFVQSINGSPFTSLTMHSGQTELWRFSNQSANRFFHLSLPGHIFNVINMDGAPTTQVVSVDMLDIAPAARVDVLVEAGEVGTTDIISHHVLTGSGAERSLTRILGKLEVTDAIAPLEAAPLPVFAAQEDLRNRPIDETRKVVLSQSKDGEHFQVNNRMFDESRIDTRVPLGNVEEWTISDTSNDLHVFHIHQLHFQVTEINGQKQPFLGYVDTVEVPAGGDVKFRMAFTDPTILGTFMYHCHILEHEDKGMMAHIEVYDPAKEPTMLGRFWNRLTSSEAKSNDMEYCKVKPVSP